MEATTLLLDLLEVFMDLNAQHLTALYCTAAPADSSSHTASSADTFGRGSSKATVRRQIQGLFHSMDKAGWLPAAGSSTVADSDIALVSTRMILPDNRSKSLAAALDLYKAERPQVRAPLKSGDALCCMLASDAGRACMRSQLYSCC